MRSLRAANTRPWPAIIVPSSPTSTGLVQPHSRMEAAIWLTCVSLCVRAFRAKGINRSIGHRSTWSAGQADFPTELATGWDLTDDVLSIFVHLRTRGFPAYDDPLDPGDVFGIIFLELAD